MSKYVVGLDAGTTGVRAVLFDRSGQACARGYAELRSVYPHPGWVEQDPAELRDAAYSVIAQALQSASAKPSDVAALGIANQRSSIVAWEAGSGRPLSAMINWQDTRCEQRCLELQDQGLFITSMMAAPKAEWILNNVAEASVAARSGTLRFGTPNSWLATCLCGDVNMSDHANASATGLYAHFESGWDAGVLDKLGLDIAWLPELVDSSAHLALLREEVLGAAVPLAGMAGDQQASLFGLACFGLGDTKCSYGTSAMVTSNTGDSVALGGVGTYPIVAWRIGEEQVYSLEGNVVTAGAAIQWLRDGLGIIQSAGESAALAASLPDSGGVWAVPAFQGLGTPAMRSEARALIGGLSRGSERGHIVRALLESIAHRVVDVVESVWENSVPGSTLHVDGGAAANDFLLQAQADLLGIPVERSSVLEGAACGAAKLAGLAVGFWADIGELEGLWKTDGCFEPGISEDQREAERDVWSRRMDLAMAAVE